MSETEDKYSQAWWGPNGNIWTSKYYLEFANWREREKTELPVLQKLIGNPPKSILDIPCGFGRLHKPLSNMDYKVYGVDINPDFVKIANNHSPRNSLVGNMLQIPFADSSFDTTLNMFSSFGYFRNRQSDSVMLKEMARVTKKGGSIVLDLQNPYSKLANFKSEWTNTMNDSVTAHHTAIFDPIDSVIHEQIKYVDSNGKEEFGIISMRVYTPHELTELGVSLGLKPTEVLSKDGGVYSTKSGRYWIKFLKP